MIYFPETQHNKQTHPFMTQFKQSDALDTNTKAYHELNNTWATIKHIINKMPKLHDSIKSTSPNAKIIPVSKFLAVYPFYLVNYADNQNAESASTKMKP